MSEDLAKLIEKIPSQKQQELLLKFGLAYRDLRREILSCLSSGIKEFDDLIFDEWRDCSLQAVSEDLWEAEVDEECGLKDVYWEKTLKTVEKAVEVLLSRNLKKEALSLLSEVGEEIEGAIGPEVYDDPEYGEIYVEYDDSWKDDFARLKVKIEKGQEAYQNLVFQEYVRQAEHGFLSSAWFAEFSSKENKLAQLQVIEQYMDKRQKEGRDVPYDYFRTGVDIIKSVVPEQLEDFFKKYKDVSFVKDAYENFLIEQKRYTEAMDLLEEDVASESYFHEKSDTYRRLCRLVGNKEKLKRELLRRINDKDGQSVDLFEELRKEVSEEEYVALTTNFINNKQADPIVRLELCEIFGNVGELKKILLNGFESEFNKSLNGPILMEQLIRYDDFISSSDPEFVPNLVIKNASRDLRGTNVRAQYSDWANRLKYLCTGGHREAQARAEASRILWKFKTRPALVDEMNKAGFQRN